MDSDTLNLIAKLVTEAYQNTRDDVLREKAKITKLINNLKKEKGFGTIKENTIGNQVDLYSNMYEVTADGDFMFKNPDRLTGAEKEFLEFMLYKINKNRHPEYTDEQLKRLRDSNDKSYYRVPLARGHIDSKIVNKTLFKDLRNKIKLMTPWKALRNLNQNSLDKSKDRSEGIFREGRFENDGKKL